MLIKKDNLKNKYKRLKRYKDKKIYIKNKPIDDLENAFIIAFNEKNKRKRYEFIYDYMYEYLDNNFCMLCDFKGNKCIANRLNKSLHKENGCCYLKRKGVCKYLKNKKCINPNISCKLFMCDYIEKKILKFRSVPKNYVLFDFFLNRKQKNIIQRSYGKNKEEIIKKLINTK